MNIGAPPFPISAEQLSTDFLSDALGRRVASWTAERIGADRGMLGVVLQVAIEYEDDPGPSPLVVKFAALREGSLENARQAGTHERELRFYSEVAPTTPVTVPRCYHAAYDPSTAYFVLVQDAVETDISVDQIVGISANQAALVLAETAKLHARWWNDPSLQAMSWLPRVDDERRRDNLVRFATNGWAPLCDLVGKELSAQETRLGREFPERLDDCLRYVAGLPSTLVHSDLRADNLLFSTDGDAVTLIDWQGAGVAPASWDLAYFLSQCLSVEARREHEEDLLHFYVRELNAAGIATKIDEVLAGYGEAMIYGLAVASALPMISEPGTPRVKSLAATMARRAIEALRDHKQLWGDHT